MLLVNKYTCKKTGNEFIQAHDINVKNMSVNKSFDKMAIGNITLFGNYKNVLMCEVAFSHQLGKVNFVKIE